MLLKEIALLNFRNFAKLTLSLHPKINVLVGPNGSGKTSLLESIYFLVTGRSFRTNKTNNLIQYNRPFMAVRANYVDNWLPTNITISTIKYLNKDRVNKIGGAVGSSSAEIAAFTPTQIINEDIGKLIFKEAEGRRKFLDWVVFYVNKSYHQLWVNFNHILQQRNKILKTKTHSWQKTLEQTDKVFDGLAQKIAQARERAWQLMQPTLAEVLQDLNIEQTIIPNITLDHGWNGELLEQLKNNQESDLYQGFTSCGPHRADLKMLNHNKPAKEWLSRGQGKVLALALMLARAKFIAVYAGPTTPTSTLLIDDFWSELDQYNTQKIIESTLKLTEHTQLLITTTDHSKKNTPLPSDICRWFEINNGIVQQLQP